MQSSVCAVLRGPASRRVSGHAACPWRLYYTRYYTGAAIGTSQPTVAIYQDLLAIAFEQDLGFPLGSARQLTQAIPGAQLTWIPDAGHGVFTHAAEVGELLLKFFAAT